MPVELPAEFFATIRRDAPRGLRWFAPEDVHVTVAFFGAWQEAKFMAVSDVMATIPRPDITVSCGPLVALPTGRRFSALSLSFIAGMETLQSFMMAHHAPLMEVAGLPPDPRAALPHATLARPVRGASHRERRAILEWAANLRVPEVTVRLHRLAIYGWSEDRDVRQFRILAEN